MYKKTISITTVLFLSLVSIVSALEPNLNLIVSSDKAEYSPGDNVTLYILINGLGEPEYGSIYFYAPEYLIDENSLSLTDFHILPPNSTNNCASPLIINESRAFNAFTLSLDLNSFKKDCTNPGAVISNSFYPSNGTIILDYTPDNPTYIPFIQVKFKLNGKAPPGINQIYLSFNYIYGDKAYSSENHLQIKVLNLYERFQWSINITLIVIGVISFIALVEPNLYKKLKKNVIKCL